jgi:hypothetical protein
VPVGVEKVAIDSKETPREARRAILFSAATVFPVFTNTPDPVNAKAGVNNKTWGPSVLRLQVLMLGRQWRRDIAEREYGDMFVLLYFTIPRPNIILYAQASVQNRIHFAICPRGVHIEDIVA